MWVLLLPVEDLGLSEVQGFKIRRFRVNNVVLGIATDVGPRILLVAPAEEPDNNLFGIVPEFTIETPEGLWRIYGGHRLWISPEVMPRTYCLLYTSPSPRDLSTSRMPSSA